MQKHSSKDGLIKLINDCYCSQIVGSPANWKQAGANPNKQWYVWYRFYDPEFKDDPKYGKKGKLVIIKNGINHYKTLGAKRQLMEAMLDTVKEIVIEQGYNPITNIYMKPVDDEIDYIVSPKTPFINALKKAAERLDLAPTTKTDVNSVINGIENVAKKLRLTDITIEDIKRRHIIKCLEACKKFNPKFTNKRYNKYRAYLLMLFKELVTIEAADSNPIKDIPIMKKGTDIEQRELLTDEERIQVDSFLREKYYRFWVFLNIFFHSGMRETEILKVKAEDVDLLNQKVKVTILKGQTDRIVYKTIKDVAVNFWQQALVGSTAADYVFSKGLMPGTHKIRNEQISRRWREHVKKKLGIQKDFYPLKHLNTDETEALLGLKIAAAHNNHSEEIAKKHYTPGRDERIHQVVKYINNSFVPDK